MITVINRDYVYEKVNKTFCLNHKMIADEIVGQKLEDLWGKENFISSIKDNIDKCFRGNMVYYQAFFETPAWGKRYFEVVMKPLSGRENEVTHILAETYDITELKLKEQEASDLEWEFKNLESNLPIGFFRSDDNGRLLHVNRAFLKIMEATSESDVAGHLLGDYYTDKEQFTVHVNILHNESKAAFGRIEMLTAECNKIVCRLSAFVVRDSSGKLIYIDGAIEDFTHEAYLEKKLQQAQKIDTIGLLAGGIAHDFNTILTTIYGYSELALEGIEPSSETYQNIRKIVQAVGRARSLTGQILTFSRQVGQERISVPVKEILEEAIGFIRPHETGNIVLKEEILAPDIYVSADPTQLFRVFINLAGNAIQAMESTGGRLTVTLDRRSGDEVSAPDLVKKAAAEYALIRFSDTGPGMDETTAGRIFEPFFTAGKQGKGTGLGLSVAYGIIAEIDGEIVVSTKKDMGTTIDVLIPSVVSPLAGKETTASRASVLLITEDDSEAKVISLALTNSGFAVELLNPEEEWLAKAGQSDLVILFDRSHEIPSADMLFELSRSKVTTPVLLISEFDVWLNAEKELPSDLVKANLFRPVSLKEIIYSIDSLIHKSQ